FSLFGGGGVSGLNLGSIIVAVIGALVLLFLYRMFVGRRGSTSYWPSFASWSGPACTLVRAGFFSLSETRCLTLLPVRQTAVASRLHAATMAAAGDRLESARIRAVAAVDDYAGELRRVDGARVGQGPN